MNLTSRLAVLSAAAVLCGCATVATPSVDMHAPAPVASQPLPVAAPANGAIFQAAAHRPLFEDRRARLVGDTLTIQIEETLNASQQSTSKINRSGSISAGMTALPFASTRFLGRLNAGGESEVTGDGSGQTGSNNNFSGSITVLVRQVMPNGNLLVVGDKQIGVNQNVDVLRFSGIVNPATIRGGNVVSSTQVADARIEQRGRGDIGRVQGLGWLARFFLSVAPV